MKKRKGNIGILLIIALLVLSVWALYRADQYTCPMTKNGSGKHRWTVKDQKPAYIKCTKCDWVTKNEHVHRKLKGI